MKRVAWVCLCVSLLTPISNLNAFELELAVSGWLQQPEGHVSYGKISAADDLDLENDLGYGDQTRLWGRLKLAPPLFFPSLYFMASPIEFDGTGAKNVDFSFGDQAFEGNVAFYSELRLDSYDVALYYGLPFVGALTAGRLQAELGFNVRVVDFEGKVRQRETGLERSESELLPIPMAYLGLKLRPIRWLAIEGEGRGLSVGEDHAYSLIGRIRITLVGPLFGSAGYRYDVIDVEVEDLDADVTVGGPFLEVGLSF